MSKGLQVLFLSRKFPPSVGGMERFAFDLSESLDSKVELEKITWGGSNKWLFLVLPYFTVRASLKLLTNRKIQVIHMQDAVQAPIGWLLHSVFRKPYIVVAHGLDITHKKRYYQWLILPFVRRADKVICISTATKNEAIARGVDPTKAKVVTLGVHDDYGRPHPDRSELSKLIGQEVKDKKLLLTTGRLTKRKGVEWFITNVLPELAKKDGSVIYLVAGDGAERQSVMETVRKKDMQSNVAMLGRVSNEARALLYQSCDIFVMPNIIVPGDMEGFGIVAHEAATAAVLVVASDLEGIRDAIKHNNNGILVKSGEAKAFVKVIQDLLSDEKRLKKLGAKFRQYTLKNFTWDKIANQYVHEYRSVIR